MHARFSIIVIAAPLFPFHFHRQGTLILQTQRKEVVLPPDQYFGQVLAFTDTHTKQAPLLLPLRKRTKGILSLASLLFSCRCCWSRPNRLIVCIRQVE